MKIDGRKLSHKTLEELRIRTVKQVEAGVSPELLAESLGLHRSTIYGWISRKLKLGDEGLKAKPISGRPATLNPNHIKWLCATLTNKTPQQLQLPFALWTRDQIREALRRKFELKLSRSAITRMLKKLGFTFQKPAFRFKQQDVIIVKKWMSDDFAKIKAQAKKLGAEIFFGDEAGVSSNYKLGKTVGKKGETPIVIRTGKRFKINMLSAISMKGECRFMLCESNVNAAVFLEFLKRLISGVDKQIFLILDNHPIHKSPKIKDFVASTNGKLCLFFLPPYSPELNPDELVWNDVKNHGLSRHLIYDLNTLKTIVKNRLFKLQKSVDKIKSFFQTPTTAYTLA